MCTAKHSCLLGFKGRTLPASASPVPACLTCYQGDFTQNVTAGGEEVVEPKENSDGTGLGSQGPELLYPMTFSRDYQIKDNQEKVKNQSRQKQGVHIQRQERQRAKAMPGLTRVSIS